MIVWANKERKIKRLWMSYLTHLLASKIEKEEDVIKIGVCMGGSTNANKEMALKLTSGISSEIGKREDMRGIGVFMTDVMGVDREVAREIVNRLNPKLSHEIK